MSLLNALEKVEAEAARLRREIAAGPCREYGHDWQLLGGANAGCSENCDCSVPVHQCTKCGDCDYGQNDEANETRAQCAEQNKAGTVETAPAKVETARETDD